MLDQNIAMHSFLDTYCRLVTANILLAGSVDEVKSLVSQSIIKLEEEKVQKGIIIRFIETIIDDMDALGPANLSSVQWNNARQARILLQRRKRQLLSQPLI
jgi:hypothetical protein